MELPVQFVYTENGKKSSIDENKKINYIDRFNRNLLDYEQDGMQRDSTQKFQITKRKHWQFAEEKL